LFSESKVANQIALFALLFCSGETTRLDCVISFRDKEILTKNISTVTF
jgi:hypothetical protein